MITPVLKINHDRSDKMLSNQMLRLLSTRSLDVVQAWKYKSYSEDRTHY